MEPLVRSAAEVHNRPIGALFGRSVGKQERRSGCAGRHAESNEPVRPRALAERLEPNWIGALDRSQQAPARRQLLGRADGNRAR